MAERRSLSPPAVHLDYAFDRLLAYAERHGYRVAPEMVIEDDGFTGAILERPGLERVRDLAAEGRIEAVLLHAPDRLNRRYAYQVLIIEELARQGVETVFLNAPSMQTAKIISSSSSRG